MTECHSSHCPYRLFSDFMSHEDRFDSKHSPIDSVIIVDRLIQMLSSSRTYSVTKKNSHSRCSTTVFKWCTIYAGGTKRATGDVPVARLQHHRKSNRPFWDDKTTYSKWTMGQSMEMGRILHTTFLRCLCRVLTYNKTRKMRGLPYMQDWNRYFKHILRAKRSGQKRECRDDVRRAVHYTFRLIPTEWAENKFFLFAKSQMFVWMGKRTIQMGI